MGLKLLEEMHLKLGFVQLTKWFLASYVENTLPFGKELEMWSKNKTVLYKRCKFWKAHRKRRWKKGVNLIERQDKRAEETRAQGWGDNLTLAESDFLLSKLLHAIKEGDRNKNSSLYPCPTNQLCWHTELDLWHHMHTSPKQQSLQ